MSSRSFLSLGMERMEREVVRRMDRKTARVAKRKPMTAVCEIEF